MSFFTITSHNPVRVDATTETPITLLNKGDSFYYGQSPSTSAQNKVGTVAANAQLALTIPTYIISASSSLVEAFFPPPQTVVTDLTEVNADIVALESAVTTLNSEVATNGTDIDSLQASVDTFDADIDNSLIVAEAYTDAPAAATAIAGNHTFAIGDEANVILETTTASAHVLTVPAAGTADFADGAVIEVARMGSGTVTFVAAGGVTIQSEGGALTIASQYGVATLRKKDDTTWHLVTSS